MNDGLMMRTVTGLVLFSIFALSVSVRGSNDVNVKRVIRDGSCGKNLTWSLHDSILSINGTGDMDQFSLSGAPWYDVRNSIKYAILEDGVTSIGYFAFQDCVNLTGITIPESVVSIYDSAFYNCKGLESITLPSGIKTISSYLLYSCSSLTSVIIPSGVKTIGKYAFSQCSGLQSMIIPAGVAQIEVGAFALCSSLITIDVAEENVYFKSIDGVLFSYDLKNLVTYPIGKDNVTYTVPTGVEEIGKYAFFYSSNLREVIIPDGVRAIGERAFESCVNLTTVNIPYGVTSLEKSVFNYCYSLETMSIPDSVTTIGDSAFFGCSGIRVLTIPNSVISIEPQAFSYCSCFVDLVIPDSVRSIGFEAFSDCWTLESVILPDGITTIDGAAFYDCPKLKSVFYEGTRVITKKSFYDVDTVCVPPDYDSASFCGANVTSELEICKSFQSKFNHCYKASYIDGDFISVKRENATEWENKTDKCHIFICDNKTGPINNTKCAADGLVMNLLLTVLAPILTILMARL